MIRADLEKYIEDHQKFILMGRPNEFFVGDYDPLTFALIKSKNNQELYKKNNFRQIDKYFYSILKDDVFRINSNLKKIAKDLDITYLERFDYACDNIEKICKSTNSKPMRLASALRHRITLLVSRGGPLKSPKNR